MHPKIDDHHCWEDVDGFVALPVEKTKILQCVHCTVQKCSYVSTVFLVVYIGLQYDTKDI